MPPEVVYIQTDTPFSPQHIMQAALSNEMKFVLPQSLAAASVSSIVPRTKPVVMDVGRWSELAKQVLTGVLEYREMLKEPVRVIDSDHVQIKEHMMLPERPYVVEYQGDVYEFIKKLDGSIVVSEIRTEK